MRIDVYLDSKLRPNGRLDRFRVEENGGKEQTLYFDIESEQVDHELGHFDPAAVALVFFAMNRGRDVHFHGPVSQILLENLEVFQDAWVLWIKRYKKIQLTADHEVTETAIPQSQDAICTFSGGVDATFSVHRHYFKKPGHRFKQLKSAVLVQGFDIRTDDLDGMNATLSGVRRMLRGLDISVSSVKTNLKEDWLPDWLMNFGAGCAAVLHLFSSMHSFGIIGADETYDHLVTPVGSNPITNHLMSSQGFKILYDGAGYSRSEKVRHIASWKAAADNLRVCWQGQKMGFNCGGCEKCIRTKLNFLASGLEIPVSFPDGISLEQISNTRIPNEFVKMDYREILVTAARNGIEGQWVESVRQLLG